MRMVLLSFASLFYVWATGLLGCSNNAGTLTVDNVTPDQEKTDVEIPDLLPDEVVQVYDLFALEQEGIFADLDKNRLLTTLDDPAYRSGPKTFVGYDLDQLLSKLDGFTEYDQDAHTLRFVCKDGYRTNFEFSSLQGARGLVASGLEGGDWETYSHGKKILTPDPFYLVWENEPISKKRPWPYQLTSIEIVSKDAIASRITPPDQTFASGAESYKQYCMACHSMNLSGGEMGPELNVPQNICEYRDRDYLKRFIKNPQSFRTRSTMPSMSHLEDTVVDSVVDYICSMQKKKLCSSADDCLAKLAAGQ